MSSQTLVPPGRLGALLIEHRRRAGHSVADVAARSSRFTASELDRIERGGVSLNDQDVDHAMELYGVNLSKGTYGRSELVVDMKDRTIGVGETQLQFDATTSDIVLERYVSLLYLLREQPVGTRLPLRDNDLATLGTALDRAERRLIDDLQGIMGDRRTIGRTRRMSRRRRVLQAGVLVGATMAGALVMVGDILPTAAAAEVDNSPAGRGELALASTGFDVGGMLPGWSIDWSGDHPVFGGMTYAPQRSITVHVDPAWTQDRLTDILVHEIGHAIDLEHLDDSTRIQWMRMRGISSDAGWWTVDGGRDFHVGAGDFAEAVAVVVAGTPSDSDYGDFTPAQLDFIRNLLDDVSSSNPGIIQ